MPTQLNSLGRNVDKADKTGDYPGTSRTGTIIWARTAPNATPVELWRDGVTNRRFVIDSTVDLAGIINWRAVAFTATRANSQAWDGYAGFIMSGGALTIVTNSVATEMPTAGTMTLALTADNTNKSLLFTATSNAEECIWIVKGDWTVVTALGTAYLT